METGGMSTFWGWPWEHWSYILLRETIVTESCQLTKFSLLPSYTPESQWEVCLNLCLILSFPGLKASFCAFCFCNSFGIISPRLSPWVPREKHKEVKLHWQSFSRFPASIFPGLLECWNFSHTEMFLSYNPTLRSRASAGELNAEPLILIYMIYWLYIRHCSLLFHKQSPSDGMKCLLSLSSKINIA